MPKTQTDSERTASGRRRPGRRSARRSFSAWHAVAICLLCAGLMLAWLSAARAGEPGAGAGGVLQAGAAQVRPELFQTGTVTRPEEQTEPSVVFDPAVLPGTDQTCYRERGAPKYLRIERPADEAAFPRNIAPPQFRWEDQVDNAWLLTLEVPGREKPLRVVTDRRRWRPDAETWQSIKEEAGTEWIGLEVRGRAVEDDGPAEDAVYADRVKFRISQYPADPLIVYRLVSPLFHGFKTPDIYYRDIGRLRQHMFLPSKGAYCTNCHSFPDTSGAEGEDLPMAVAVRGSRGSLRLLGLYEFGQKKGSTQMINSFFMDWGPDGRKVAVTGGEDTAVRYPITLETQQFHVKGADIWIVDRQSLEVSVLHGAADPDYMETLPAWSVDGRTIWFARAKEFSGPVPKIRYDLYKVPYNGGLGGEPVPVPGASHNGKSNYAPRFSPDGKWMAFTKADYGTLVEPTADLWIMSTKEGARPRKLNCNSDVAMDSHHSWSSNGHWLLFASKRDDGIFARIYLTEIDEQGHASPPVRLPALDDPMMCYNVPEFLKYRPEVDPESIFQEVSHPGKAEPIISPGRGG